MTATLEELRVALKASYLSEGRSQDEKAYCLTRNVLGERFAVQSDVAVPTQSGGTRDRTQNWVWPGAAC
jgi:hypothetical protein